MTQLITKRLFRNQHSLKILRKLDRGKIIILIGNVYVDIMVIT